MSDAIELALGALDYAEKFGRAAFSTSELKGFADAAAALRKERETGGWRDIATAPKDGTDIILFMPAEEHPVDIGRCKITANDQNLWIIGGKFGFDMTEPTHWRSVPPPPAKERTE